MKCPKCGSECRFIDFVEGMVYIWCVNCPYHTFESKRFINKPIERFFDRYGKTFKKLGEDDEV